MREKVGPKLHLVFLVTCLDQKMLVPYNTRLIQKWINLTNLGAKKNKVVVADSMDLGDSS